MQTHRTDDVFRILADGRRRLVVRYLVDQGTTSCRDVADHVAARREEDFDDVLVALRHRTLPMLVEADLVEYDPERGQVRYRSSSLVEETLRVVETE